MESKDDNYFNDINFNDENLEIVILEDDEREQVQLVRQFKNFIDEITPQLIPKRWKPKRTKKEISKQNM